MVAVAAVVAIFGVAVFGLAPRNGSTSLLTAAMPDQIYLRSDVDVIVFLEPMSTPDQHLAVEGALRTDANVGQAWSRSQEDAMADFLCYFADSPELIASVGPEILPPSFQVALVDGDGAADLAIAMEHITGVTQVVVDPGPDGLDAEGRTVKWSMVVDSGCSGPGRPIK